MLSGFAVELGGPDLPITCKNATELSQRLVARWLQDYMLRDDPDAKSKAEHVAEWLSGHNNFKDHSRPIGREELKDKGLKINDLEESQDVQDHVLSVFHAVSITFTSTPTVKIIENHLGKAFMKFGSAP